MGKRSKGSKNEENRFETELKNDKQKKKWKKKKNRKIKIDDWDKHFKRLLGKVKWRMVRKEDRVREENKKKR